LLDLTELLNRLITKFGEGVTSKIGIQFDGDPRITDIVLPNGNLCTLPSLINLTGVLGIQDSLIIITKYKEFP